MRALFWLLAIFALAVGLSLAGKFSTGYALLVYPPYRMELSLNLLVLLMIGGFFLVYGVVRLTTRTLQLPAKVAAFRAERHRKQAREAMIDGLRAFLEGRYAKAEQATAKALELGEEPGLNAILAARAAHELRAHAQCETYLARAETLAPGEFVARLITQADILLNQHRPEEALEALKDLRLKAGMHTAALRLELKAHQQARNWDQVLNLTTQLEKRSALEPVQAEQFKIYAHSENLKDKSSDPIALKEYWKRIATPYKRNYKVADAAARGHINIGECRIAHEIIEDSLNYNWNSGLVELYGMCLGDDVLKQIHCAETWLKSQPQDAALLLVLGKLCINQELWGKAQSYLEAGLAIEPTHSAHIALAQTLEKLEQAEEADSHYRQALDLTLNLLRNTTGGRRKVPL